MKIVLFLGRLHPKKQPDVVIRAFLQTGQRFPDWMLVMAGSGETKYTDQLRRIAADCGMGERVLFTGLLEGGATQEAFTAAGVFVLPSLQENFGYSIFEALAAGCPAIISEGLDMAQEIIRARAGIACKPDVSAVSEAMRRVMADEPASKRMGENGHRLVLGKYTSQKMAERLMKAYGGILSGKRNK